MSKVIKAPIKNQIWKFIWETAFKKVEDDPRFKISKVTLNKNGVPNKTSMNLHRGVQAELARHLGYANGNGIYNAWINGSEPTKERQQLLFELCGFQNFFHATIAFNISDRKPYPVSFFED